MGVDVTCLLNSFRINGVVRLTNDFSSSKILFTFMLNIIY